MTTSVISVVKDEQTAGKVIDALREEGFKDQDVKILNGIADKLLGELPSTASARRTPKASPRPSRTA
jgi:hypothetical protein